MSSRCVLAGRRLVVVVLWKRDPRKVASLHTSDAHSRNPLCNRILVFARCYAPGSWFGLVCEKPLVLACHCFSDDSTNGS